MEYINSHNKLFVGLGAEIEKLLEKDGAAYLDAFKSALLNKSGKSRFPNDHDFMDKFMTFELYNAKASVRKYLLERFENFGNREMIAVEEQISDGSLTIEHIMPQTLTEEWTSKYAAPSFSKSFSISAPKPTNSLL